MEDGWERRARAGVLAEHALLGPDFVRLSLSAGRADRAARIVDEVDEAARRLGTPTATGAALRCRGLAEDDVDLLSRAIDVLRQGPRPLEHGRACEEAAAVLGRRSSAPDAPRLLEEAASIYESLGALRDLARVEAELRRCGVRRGRRGSRPPRPTAGWDSLTRTELEVVGLVGQGLTNAEIGKRLFISPRTVECHLSHVFAKLELASRSALRAEVGRGDRLRAGGRRGVDAG